METICTIVAFAQTTLFKLSSGTSGLVFSSTSGLFRALWAQWIVFRKSHHPNFFLTIRFRTTRSRRWVKWRSTEKRRHSALESVGNKRQNYRHHSALATLLGLNRHAPIRPSKAGTKNAHAPRQCPFFHHIHFLQQRFIAKWAKWAEKKANRSERI